MSGSSSPCSLCIFRMRLTRLMVSLWRESDRSFTQSVGRMNQPTLVFLSYLVLLYHMLFTFSSAPSFPAALDWLAQLCNDLWSQRNPPRRMRSFPHTFQ